MKGLVLIFLGFSTLFARISPGHRLDFVSPLPGSTMVSRESNIVIRFKSASDVSIVSGSLLTAAGSKSGIHSLTATLSDDQRTVVFHPDQPFQPDEIVTLTAASREFPEFSFRISPKPNPDLSKPYEYDFDATGSSPKELPDRVSALSLNDTLPSDFPAISITTFGKPLPKGVLYMDNFARQSVSAYLMNVSTYGTVTYYQKTSFSTFDFKKQPNGLLSYYDRIAAGFVVTDSLHNQLDVYRAGNGYPTDIHEFRMLSNGHSLLLADDAEPVRMDTVVAGGDSNATVDGIIIQELDAGKNVVFQWRSWDHFKITDAVGVDLTAHVVDYCHANALELDYDGNILLSSRHMDEITKIDRNTGDIIWRWGGKNNQFIFLNDTVHFSHQHAVRRLPNGHITLFDNGNFHTPSYSRAVEYAVDEQAKTATVAWLYRNQPDIYGSALGYVQRMDDGNTLICWGAANPNVTIVAPDSTKILQMSFPQSIYTYRAYFYQGPQPVISVSPASFSVSLNPQSSLQESLKIANYGLDTLLYAPVVTQHWVVIDTTTRSLLAGDSTFLHFSLDASSLSQWSAYDDTLTILSNDSLRSPWRIPIHLSTLGPKIALHPASIHAETDSSLVVSKAFMILNTGSAPLGFSLSNGDTAQHWLSLTGAAGSIPPGDSSAIIIAMDAGALSPGNYSDSLTAASNDSSTGPLVVHVSLKVYEEDTVVAAMSPGWNIVSLPVTPHDAVKSHLFPGASSSAFSYEGSYVIHDSLQPGFGYWLKYPSGQSVPLRGLRIIDDSLEVFPGWNLVGSLTFPVPASSVTSAPDDIIQSSFFKFSGGYSRADTIKPGSGYWLKASQHGLILYSQDEAPQNLLKGLKDLNSLTVSDAHGGTQTLYFGAAPSLHGPQFDLPPLPPENCFDARFESGRFVEEIPHDGSMSFMVRTTSPSLGLSWNFTRESRFRLSDRRNDSWALAGSGSFSLNLPSNHPAVFDLSVESPKLPEKYSLEQNFPNPFNPGTRIRFSLPEGARVRLQVMNVLGQVVSTLIDSPLEPGYHSAWFDAREFSSGIYFYRLQAGNFVEVRKMMSIR